MKNSFFTATGVGEEYKYLGIWMQPNSAATLYIDDVTVKEVVIKEDEPVESKTYDFENADGITTKSSSYKVENGTLVNEANWAQRIGFDFVLKNNQEYNITMKYKVKLNAGQTLQAVNIRWYAGSKNEVKQLLKNEGWINWKNTAFKTYKTTITIDADQLTKNENYIWLDLNADPGTDKPTLGGGKIIIDSVFIEESKPITPDTTKIFTFDNEDDILYLPDSAKINNGALNEKCGWGHILKLDYTLAPNSTYQMTVKYRVTGEQQLDVGICSMGNDRYTLSKLFNWFTTSKTEWTTKTIEFKTTDENVHKSNRTLALYLNCDGSYGNMLVIDEIKVVRYDVVINFKASYNGIDLDIDSIGGAVGESVTLPVKITKPYELIGWYYDSGLTKSAGKKITLGNSDVTLYGKIKYNTKAVIDFEDEDFCYPISGAQKDYIEISTDPDNANNKVLKTQIFKSFNSTYMRINYMWQNSHKYKITLKYKVNKVTTVQIFVRNSTVKNSWDSAGSETFANVYSAAVYGSASPDGGKWLTSEAEFTTDDPAVDNIFKYMFLAIRLTRPEGTEAPILYVDDIVIEDLGPFDPSGFVTEIDEYTWEPVKEDMTNYNAWKNWEVQSLDGTQALGDSNGTVSTVIIVLSICGGVAALAAIGILLVILLKKRKKSA